MASRIEDYALIGDCHTAALAARNGSIDWLCFPRFDSGACFAALLGTEEHGCWSLSPAGKIRQIRRGYHDDTLVLETEFETADGVVSVIDCMPPRSKEADLVRIVVGKRGQVSMHMQLVLRPDYGSIIPWVRRTENGICAVAGPDTLTLQSDVNLRNENFKTEAEFTVSAGQRLHFVLIWHPSHESDSVTADAEALLAQAERWWQEWAGHCTYKGPYQKSVIRSLVTLKALTYAPTGGIVAAPTTSLPEWIGGYQKLGLPLLLGSGCDVHSLRLDAGGLHRRSRRVARLASPGGRRQAVPAQYHVWPGGRRTAPPASRDSVVALAILAPS